MDQAFNGADRKWHKEKILMVVLALLIATIACSDSPNSSPDIRVKTPITKNSSENEIKPIEPTETDTSPVEDDPEIIVEVVEAFDEISTVDQMEAGQKYTGIVNWFSNEKGYGFITPDDGGADLLVHYSAIMGKGYRTLEEGQKVNYNLFEGKKGLAAVDVVVIDSDTSADDGKEQAVTGDRRTGVVNWFNVQKGFGFITPDGGGQDLFVHYSYILEEGYRALEDGQKVEYTPGESDKGPAAFDVTIIK